MAIALVVTAAGCGGSASRSRQKSIVVFNAGALALPLRQALDSFARRNDLTVSQESAGSVETIRKITELGRVPDIVAVADTGLFSRLVPGRLTGPIGVLGRSRLVLAYTDRSRFANEVNATNWTDIITRAGVQVGRSDPTLDPAGYRALMAMQLAERHYARPGLAQRLQSAAPASNIRPKSADLVALLQTGNLDYAWEYESVARKLGLRYIVLPPQVDLSDPAFTATYATARVDISPSGDASSAGGPHTPVFMYGAPIVFGAGVLKDAPHAEAAHRFIMYVMSPEGRSIFASNGLEPATATSASSTR